MCGRFTQQLSWAELHDLADLIGQQRNERGAMIMQVGAPFAFPANAETGYKVKEGRRLSSLARAPKMLRQLSRSHQFSSKGLA